jgi:RNA polymerase sigma-70 factor (ECF subfamily)
VDPTADPTTLIRMHQPQLRAFCAGFRDDPHDRDELAQLVMIRVWRGLAGFDGRASFSTWLYQIVRNTAMTEYARSARRPVPVEVAAECEPVGPARMLSLEDRVAERDALHRAMRALDDRFRDAVARVDLFGCSTAEAAALAGIAEPTVRTRLFRGRRHLRAVLAGDAA